MSKFLGKKGKKNGKVADVPERKMPEAASLDSLIRGMESIVNRQNGVVTTQDYMELYSYVYKSCSKPGKNNYTQVKPMSSADDSGYPLYNFVKEFLAKHANGLLCKFDDVHGLQLLDLYNKLWTEYQFSANVINGIFSYLNRHWIKRKVDEGAQDVLEIYNLSIKCWEDHLFAYICRRVSGAMINLITKERKGELITTSYITGTLQSYMEMGINYKLIQPQNGSSSKKRLDVYRLHFEIQFLKETREFYKEESQQFLSDNNIIEYVRKVDARLKEERLRVDRYLDPSTIEGLISVLDDALIKDYIERFKAEFERLVEQNAVDDIEKVYKLCSRVPDSLEALRLTFEKLVCKKGYDAVKNCAEAGNDPKAYITAIIQVLKTYTDMTLQAFANESGFVRALDKACINYINNNSICEDGKKSERSPDLLAKYCDILLRKSSKALQESEVEDALNDVMTVFKFIEDKDVFQQYYSKTVAKRLVFDMSASEDAEHSFISKLKNMCGFEYTSRLQRMFTDKTVSSELTLTYKKQGDNLVSKPKVDMTVMILAEGVWPFSGGEQFNIPAILGDSQAEFTSFYTAKHSGRKLNFLNNLSRGEVVCNWPKGKRFTFTTTIAQMSILLMYNDVDEHTLRELVESIGLRKDAMVQALIALVKIEILKLESGKLNPEMDMDTKIVINPKFTSFVYNTCTKLGAEKNFTQSKPSSSGDDSGYPLYNFAKDFLSIHANGLLRKFDDVHGLQLLDLYNKLWTEYQFSANVINGIFSYLNRHWIKRKIDEADDDIFEIYNLSIKCWEDHLFAYICKRVSGAMITLITKERKGELITTSYITGTLESYMEMGINYKLPPNDLSKKRLDVYRTHFEVPFLAETKDFYKEESQQFLSDNNIIEYVRKVDARLKEERLRVDRYLDPSTIESLTEVLDEALIKDYIERFKAEFERLVEHDAVDDIEKVYKLCSRIPDSLDALRLTFEKLVCKKGYDAVKNCAEAGNDPKAYISAILQVLKNYTDMTLQAFANESGFVRALDKACIGYINKNSICEDGKKSERSPDLLAKYCDILLRKSAKALQESEVEDALNDVMTVFKYIEDKDVFQQYYSKTVAKRLVSDMSASEDAEHSFISKLKNMCGFEYTNRLQRMFTDKTVSSELTQAYKKHLESLASKPRVDMSVMVLAEGVWPFNGGEKFTIPSVLVDSQAEFTSFYTAKHSGRKLNFLNNLSRGEVVCNWPKGKRFTFTTTIAQMSILLMYNDVDEHTLRELVESIGLRKDAMVQALIALVKIEILKLESGKLNPEMDMDTKIVINPKFTSRKLKVDLSRGVANRGETKKEVETMQKDLEEDRKMIIQAAIVRVMKMRKSCKHQQLVGEVIKLLSVRFNPSIKVIRLSIDSLIEKEYMKRSAEDQAMYEYIS